jgi:hypothetical protein
LIASTEAKRAARHAGQNWVLNDAPKIPGRKLPAGACFSMIVAYPPQFETTGGGIFIVESFLEAAMKRLPAVAVALAGFVWGGLAEAADMPVKAPPLISAPVPAIPFSWTGIYVGGNAGGSVGTWHAVSNTPIFEINSFTSSPRLVGAVGGAQVGFNWQFAPS